MLRGCLNATTTTTSLILWRLHLLGSCQGQSSHGLGNWKADLLAWLWVSEVEGNSKEKLCPLGRKASNNGLTQQLDGEFSMLDMLATQVSIC